MALDQAKKKFFLGETMIHTEEVGYFIVWQISRVVASCVTFISTTTRISNVRLALCTVENAVIMPSSPEEPGPRSTLSSSRILFFPVLVSPLKVRTGPVRLFDSKKLMSEIPVSIFFQVVMRPTRLLFNVTHKWVDIIRMNPTSPRRTIDTSGFHITARPPCV